MPACHMEQGYMLAATGELGQPCVLEHCMECGKALQEGNIGPTEQPCTFMHSGATRRSAPDRNAALARVASGRESDFVLGDSDTDNVTDGGKVPAARVTCFMCTYCLAEKSNQCVCMSKLVRKHCAESQRQPVRICDSRHCRASRPA